MKKWTLTNLYNQRPPWLDMAHAKLDKAVLDAYGWSHDLGDEDIEAPGAASGASGCELMVSCRWMAAARNYPAGKTVSSGLSEIIW